MKKLIRIPGFIAFIVIAALIYFALAPIIRLTLIELGEATFKAKVNIDEVSVDFSSAQLVINQVSVGDKDAPMTNLFEFNTATVDIALLKMFQGQVIIDDLSLNGLKLSTARKSSAALTKAVLTTEEKIERAEAKAKQKAIKAKLKQTLPSTDEMLAREQLKTDAAYEDLNSYYAQQKAQWDALQKDLPTKKSAANYEKELKEITSGKIKSLADFEDRKDRLKALKKKLKNDKKILAQAKDLAIENKNGLATRVKTLKNAPKADLQQLKNKYQFNEGGALNITGLLFGSDIQGYSQQGLYWYKKIKPLLEGDPDEKEVEVARSAGRFIHFGPSQEPDFWLKNAKLNAQLEQGSYDIAISNLSHQQRRTGKPVKVDVVSSAVHNMKNLTANALVDYRTADKLEQLDFVITQYQLEPIDVSKDNNLSIKLSDALVDIKGNIQHRDSKVLGTANALVNNAVFNTDAKNEFATELGLAIEAVKQFTVDVEIKGLKKLDIDSDLDKQISRALKGRLKAKQAEIEQELQAKLNAKMNNYLADLNIDQRLTDGASLDAQLKQVENLLKSELDSYEDQQKAKAKEKARQKLKDKLKDLF